MALYYVASIAPLVYPAFFDLSGGRLPPTFEEWQATHTLSRRDLVASGHHVVGLPVDPVDFRGYCRSMRCRADAVALAAFATRWGNEQFGTQADYEALRARIVVVEASRPAPIDQPGATPRRHWWQFWRPRYPAVVDRPIVGAPRPYDPVGARNMAVEETAAGPIRVEAPADDVVLDPPPRQHWWEIWRRPQAVRVVERRRSIYDRAA